MATATRYLDDDDVKSLLPGEYVVVGIDRDGYCICYDPELGEYNCGDRPEDADLSAAEARRLVSIPR